MGALPQKHCQNPLTSPQPLNKVLASHKQIKSVKTKINENKSCCYTIIFTSWIWNCLLPYKKWQNYNFLFNTNEYIVDYY